ncbi:MAG: metal-dependent hydrolase [Candidatus Hermodarchaeota archaeon]
MDFLTHLVFGSLIYLLSLREITLDYFVIAVIFSILPDLDIFLAPFRRFIKSNYLEHRGGSHSFIIGILISLLISLLTSLFTPYPFYLVWIIGSLFYGLHVSMDLLTTTNIPYLFPLSKKEHSFYVEKAGSMFTFITSIIFIFLPIVMFRFFGGMLYFQFYLNFFTYFFISYYLYRIISRIYVSTTLEKGQKYLPGILPFYFRIFSYEINGNEIIYSIKKKSHFSKKTETIRVSTILSTQEESFLSMAKEITNNHYYYAKWTLLPVFIRSEGMFSIKFFFLETMMRKRTMFIQYDFNTETHDLISSTQKSGPIQN